VVVAPPFNYQFTYVTTVSGGITVSEGGRRIVKVARDGHDAAVATPALNGAGCAADSKLFWKVRMLQVKNNYWILAGIIANPTPVSTSYGDSTAYGWAGCGQVCTAGSAVRDHDGWPNTTPWHTGDEAVFQLDLGAAELKMWHTRHARVFTIGGLPAGHTWQIHANLHGARVSLEIVEASEQDRARF
jgi:hypothetical protein